MDEQQRKARLQLSKARQRRKPAKGFSVFGESTETNPYPLIEPICLYTLCAGAVSKFVYIGCTTHPQKRLLEHLRYADHPDVNPEESAWLQELHKVNVKPKMTILETLYGNRIKMHEGWVRTPRNHAKTLEWVWAAVAEAHGFLVINWSERIAKFGLHPSIFHEIRLRMPVWERLLRSGIFPEANTDEST
jgi:hypothetical protein